MKDAYLRGRILGQFYDRRADAVYLGLGTSNVESLRIPNGVNENDVIRVCGQLADHALIDWKGQPDRGVTVAGIGKITDKGVDVIEGRIDAPIAITSEE